MSVPWGLVGLAGQSLNRLMHAVDAVSPYITEVAEVQYMEGQRSLEDAQYAKKAGDRQAAEHYFRQAADHFATSHDLSVRNVPRNRLARISRNWGPLFESANDARRQLYLSASLSASFAATCYSRAGNNRRAREWASNAREAFELYAEAEKSYHFANRSPVGHAIGDMHEIPDVSDVERRINKERRELEQELSDI